MTLGLGVNVGFAEINIDFALKPLSKKRSQVKYHPTLKKISDQGATKLIIPGDIDGCDYSYKKIIEHVRTDSDEAISMIPILVFFEDEEKYLEVTAESNEFSESWYKKIAVTFTPDPKREDFVDDIDPSALEAYLSTCYKYPYSEGRHDKANRWGSLSLLKSLLHINPNNEDLLNDLLNGVSELEDNLSEWTYFKDLIRKFDSGNVDENYIVRLKHESSKLAKISNDTTVLIIEDQLKDGWEVAYDLFFSISSNFKVSFAKNEIEAKDKINKSDNIDLILLDVRLDKDSDTYSHHIENSTGVKLAKWIRDKTPTTPIIAATASNKSWTLEALLEQGINGYWVKGSPPDASVYTVGGIGETQDQPTTVEVGIENTIDLYKKIHDTLLWSQATGNWQKELYRIADVVDDNYLRGKAKSLQALLFRSFSPFSNELSKGLQLNLAFMNIYSCMNDLVEWACEIKEVETDIWEWSTIDYSNKYVVIVRVKKGLWILPEAELSKLKKVGAIPEEYKSLPLKKQPDRHMAIQLLLAKFDLISPAKVFINLSMIRNALPLVHGKRQASGSALDSIDVSTSNINSLIGILVSFVDRHKELM